MKGSIEGVQCYIFDVASTEPAHTGWLETTPMQEFNRGTRMSRNSRVEGSSSEMRAVPAMLFLDTGTFVLSRLRPGLRGQCGTAERFSVSVRTVSLSL